MRFIKSKFIRKYSALLIIPIIAALLLVGLPLKHTEAQITPLNPDDVRQAVVQMGMTSLSTYILTDPPEFITYLRPTPAIADATTIPATTAPPATIPTPKRALEILGKALFWDQQAGSDGQACASCHFHAGADNRSKNVLNPGGRNETASERTIWGVVKSTGTVPARNYQLAGTDFPFHLLADPMETDYIKRQILFDTDDIIGSTGTFHATYAGSPAPNYGTANAGGVYDARTALAVDQFSIGTQRVRSTGPRNTPSAINAIFNFTQFWDGRAHTNFNGVNPDGSMDGLAKIWQNNGTILTQVPCIITNSSLASQSVGPPNAALSDEMAFAGRTFPQLGRKMLRLTTAAGTPTATVIPLGAQLVDATDSVLGPFKNAAGTNGGRGLNVTYRQLIQWAFQPQWWSSAGPIVAPATTPSTLLAQPGGYQLMEANFSLFWGVAIQAYETLLRADQTPYDKFMNGDNSAFDPVNGPYSQKSQDIMRGLLTYIHTENNQQQPNPVFNNINFGACQLCHSGPTLSEIDPLNVAARFFITVDMTVKMDHNRELAIVPASSSFDVGYTNVGTRPTREDIAHGANAANGVPLAFWRQFLKGYVLLPGPFVPLGTPAPNPDRGSNTDGAFKIPGLRNIELTVPYFHNGGTLTLAQAVSFYARHGDFADVNEPNIDVGLAMVQNLNDTDVDNIVKFLLTLTDERVRFQKAPFDHPQIFLPNGQTNTATNHAVLGTGYRADTILTLPAVGAVGSATPIQPFLNISSTVQAGPNNDQFDR